VTRYAAIITEAGAVVTAAMRRALVWLAAHNGEGCFDKRGCILAAGERAPITRGTVNKLSLAGFIEPAGVNRIRMTAAGRYAAEVLQ
jgi:hypothetical protein